MAKKVSPKKGPEKSAKSAKPAGKVVRKPYRPPVKAMPPVVDEKPRLKKSPLSKADLTVFRKMLLEKRRSILGDMSGMESEALRTNRQEAGGDLSLMPDHPANIATDNFEQEFTLGLLESERTLLQEINEALERIDGGTYGICLGTGQAISKARLTARPWAKYTIEYARLVEKGQARVQDSRAEMPDEEPAGEDEEPEEIEEELPDTSEE